MGAWSQASFGNDQALDLLISLESLLEGTKVCDGDELLRAFQSYESYEERRRTGTNTYVLTEEKMRKDLTASGCSAGDIEYLLEKMSSVFGKETIDLGASEAYEAIAAAEVVLCNLSNDYSPLGPEGAFLANIEFVGTSQLVDAAKSALSAILRNKELVKDHGAAWARNVNRLADQVFRHAP